MSLKQFCIFPCFFVDFLNFNPLTLKKLFNILLIFYGKYKLKLLLKKLSIWHLQDQIDIFILK